MSTFRIHIGAEHIDFRDSDDVLTYLRKHESTKRIYLYKQTWFRHPQRDWTRDEFIRDFAKFAKDPENQQLAK